jgi:hypothetical protein
MYRIGMIPGLVLACVVGSGVARGDTAAAKACATGLSKDAKTIFDATLPQVGPGVDLKSAVTAKTRSLAIAGTIDRGTARDSATEAGACLKRAQP